MAQLREAMEAVASGHPWKGGAACRQQCFLITKFCHVLWLPMTLHSIHFAQYAHALPLTPHFHYANIALSLVMAYRLCYTHAVEVQPYLVHRPAKCPLLQSTVVF